MPRRCWSEMLPICSCCTRKPAPRPAAGTSYNWPFELCCRYILAVGGAVGADSDLIKLGYPRMLMPSQLAALLAQTSLGTSKCWQASSCAV